MSVNIADQIRNVAIVAIPIITAITFHEAAHGYVARLRQPKQDMVWVAAAGPAMNLLLCAISVLAIYLCEVFKFFPGNFALEMLVASIEINLILAIFNMIPIPPLDGGRVAVGLLPMPLARPLAQVGRFGLLPILLILLVLPMLGLDVSGWLVAGPVQFLERPILQLLHLQSA